MAVNTTGGSQASTGAVSDVEHVINARPQLLATGTPLGAQISCAVHSIVNAHACTKIAYRSIGIIDMFFSLLGILTCTTHSDIQLDSSL